MSAAHASSIPHEFRARSGTTLISSSK